MQWHDLAERAVPAAVRMLCRLSASAGRIRLTCVLRTVGRGPNETLSHIERAIGPRERQTESPLAAVGVPPTASEWTQWKCENPPRPQGAGGRGLGKRRPDPLRS